MEHAPVGKLEGADRGLVVVLERPVAAEQLLGHGFEVFDVERKRQADVCARLHALDALVDLLGRREQDDRDVTALAQLEQRLDAVQLGHHDVEYDQMDRVRHHDVERFQTVVRLLDLIAVRAKEDRDAVHDLAVVVHHQYLQLFHFSLPLSMLLSYHRFLLFSAGNFFRFY